MSLRDIIFLNAKDYLLTESNIPINIVVLAIGIALSVASIFIYYHKAYTLAIIKALLRREAVGEENAKTLSELHVNSSFALKRALSRKGQLTRIVKRAGYTEPTYEEYMALSKKERRGEKIDFETARFFIPRDLVDKAKLIKDKENPTVIRTLLVCLLIIALSVCFMMLMPAILTFLSNNLPKSK